jgi:hypothetical protein
MADSPSNNQLNKDVPILNQSENTPEFTQEDIAQIFNDGDNIELDNTRSNNDWLNNKAIIEYTFRTTGISQQLSNYGNNLILFYEKKIKAVKSLMDRKKSDNKKNFIGDISIQEDQKKNIQQMILNDSKVKNVSKPDLDKMINSYYTKIGDRSGEIMTRDYDDRNRTIKYILLIKEYEENIEKIRDAIGNFVGTDKDNEYLLSFLKKFPSVSGGNKQKGGVLNEISIPLESFLEDYPILIQTYSFIGDNSINLSNLATQFLYLLFKIQNACFNPLVVHEGYFNLNEIDEIIQKFEIQNSGNFNLRGGGNILDDFIYNLRNKIPIININDLTRKMLTEIVSSNTEELNSIKSKLESPRIIISLFFFVK